MPADGNPLDLTRFSRSKPCPSQSNPFTSFQQRDISALVWMTSADRSCNLSATMTCAVSSSSGPHEKPFSLPLSLLQIDLFRFVFSGYGMGPFHQTGEAPKCTRCRARLDMALLSVFFSLNRESTQRP